MARKDHELTETIQHKVCKALRLGATYELAARYAGIRVGWFWRWKKQGEQAHPSGDEPDHQRYIDFCEEIRQARAEYEVGNLAKQERLGGTHWQPLKWKYEQLSKARSSGHRDTHTKKRREVRHERE